MDDGFIKLHRQILKWEWWKDANTRAVFLWLLLNAQWKDNTFRGICIPKGGVLTSRRKIAKECMLSERNVRTALEHLQETGEISIETTRHYSIIKIEKWGEYQLTETDPQNDPLTDPQTDPPKARKTKGVRRFGDPPNDPLTDPPTDHIQEYKEIKNNYIYKRPKNNNAELIKSNYNFEELRREIKQ